MANPFQQDLRQLAVGILYINLGLADVEFPTTSASHPSYKVHVSLTAKGSLLANSNNSLFPFFVRWDVWRNVIVPIFEDGSVLVKLLGGTTGSLRVQINKEMLLLGDMAGLLAKIEQAVLRGYEEHKYVPVSTTAAGYLPGFDPPPSYLTDKQMKQEAAEAAALAVAQAAWEAKIEVDDPPDQFTLQQGLLITPPTPPPISPVPATPTAATTDLVVSAPPAPGEPVVRAGTTKLVYVQFDE